MSREITLQGSGAPSFCFICNKQLQRAPGKGKGLFYFRLAVDKAGQHHRIHGSCDRFLAENELKLANFKLEVKK